MALVGACIRCAYKVRDVHTEPHGDYLVHIAKKFNNGGSWVCYGVIDQRVPVPEHDIEEYEVRGRDVVLPRGILDPMPEFKRVRQHSRAELLTAWKQHAYLVKPFDRVNRRPLEVDEATQHELARLSHESDTRRPDLRRQGDLISQTIGDRGTR